MIVKKLFIRGVIAVIDWTLFAAHCVVLSTMFVGVLKMFFMAFKWAWGLE